MKTFGKKKNSKRKQMSFSGKCTMIAKLESLFKNNIHEFKVRHYGESWMISLGRTWLPSDHRVETKR